MRLTTPPLTIDEKDSFKNDALNREQFGIALFNLITKTKEELVICLNAPWGEGKTSFVKMWQGLLSKNQIQSIYFDAFSNDYIDDAFIAIVSRIIDFSEKEFQKDPSLKKTLDEFKKKASKVGVQLLSWATKLGVKAATLGVIKEGDIEELMTIKDDIAKGTSDVVSKFIEDRISTHNNEVQNVISFRETLSQLANNISVDSGNPLVIIIDELDRCKPTYAIELIERIKHLFSVKNIVFILVMHKKQLEESIRCLYGQNIDATSYLQKFINIDCRLPKNTEPQGINDYKKYCERLYDLHELEISENEKSDLLYSISFLSRHFDLSLRQLEKCFTYITIFYISVFERHSIFTSISAVLSILKVINPNLYAELRNNRISYKGFIEAINLSELKTEDEENKQLSRILLWMKLCLFTDDEYSSSDQREEFKPMSQSLFRRDINRQDIIPLYCNFFDIVKLR